MNKVRVVAIDAESLTFDNGVVLSSYHEWDCCENHYLSLKELDLLDFEGLEFDITGNDFFERIEGYGIMLKPLNGLPVRIPCYGTNTGYYSSNLSLVLEGENIKKTYDITECQTITYTY